MPRGASAQDAELMCAGVCPAGALSIGLKDIVGAKESVSTCPSETSTSYEVESIASMATSIDSCCWEDDFDMDDSAPTLASIATSEMWEDEFSADERLDRVKWL